MRRFRSPISWLLCIAVFASLFSGFAASAAPLKPGRVACETKPANTTEQSLSPSVNQDCCLIQTDKVASTSFDTKQLSDTIQVDCCQVPAKLPVRGKVQLAADFIQQDCCVSVPIRGKVQIGAAQQDPCAPVVDGSCGITYPAGSVVGDIPFDQAAYYEPGQLANGVTINAGTYWVTGLGEDENGDEFYQIVVACEFLFVPADTIQPSYQAPWSGQPLPTTEPVS